MWFIERCFMNIVVRINRLLSVIVTCTMKVIEAIAFTMAVDGVRVKTSGCPSGFGKWCRLIVPAAVQV